MISALFSRTPFLVPLIFSLLLLLPSHAFAEKDKKLSSGEDVAIAFFKMAGTAPNFDNWVKYSSEYQSLAPAMVGDFKQKEKQRLLRLWQKYDMREDMLNIEVPVTLEFKNIFKDSGNKEYTMTIGFDGQKVTYFPYEFGEYKFAIMPKKMEKLFTQTLNQSQYDSIQASLNRDNHAVLDLALKPTKAHTEQPYAIDNVEQWVLLADIATMALSSKNKRTNMWDYNADWYMAPATKQLMDLYRQ